MNESNLGLFIYLFIYSVQPHLTLPNVFLGKEFTPEKEKRIKSSLLSPRSSLSFSPKMSKKKSSSINLHHHIEGKIRVPYNPVEFISFRRKLKTKHLFLFLFFFLR